MHKINFRSMKRNILFLLLCISFLLPSCKKDYSIKYDGSKTIEMVLLEELTLDVESDDDLTYTSDNDMVVTVDADGKLLGKNVGEANIRVSNTENSLDLKVNVSLFEEPTLNFGISTNEIKKIYGEPRHNFGDTIYIYGSGNNWYSYAVWEMDFFFIDNQYIESDIYIRSDLQLRVDEYLNENYYLQGEYNDTIDDVVTTYYIYLNAEDPQDANVLVGKIHNVGEYKDICLFYTPFNSDKRNDYKDIIGRIKKKRFIEGR